MCSGPHASQRHHTNERSSPESRFGATLGGTANSNGAPTTGSFEYGLTTGYGSVTPGQSLGSGNSPVSIGGGGITGTTTPVQTLGAGSASVAIGGGSITGLICNTWYHFRA